MSAKPTFSFEFFPPKSEKAAETLWAAVPELAALGPSFMTCTYGAGGSTRDGTVDTVTRMERETGLPMAAHLTFINTVRPELQSFTDQLWNANIRHIVALRGDMPDDLQWPLDPDGDYFQYTSDFVEGLKSWHDFEISVGAYPEKHPDAPDLSADIEALRKKCDAGADRAITQFFFDNDVYYNFVEECQKAGITTPIVPGLLPVHDFKSMCNFAGRCQATVPQWLREKFENTDDPAALATELLCTQVEDLAASGVPHIHFYTLNKADVTKEACAGLKNN